MRHDVRSVFLDMALKYSEVWMAISRVGERITQRAPTTWECYWSFWTTGIMKAPVLPDPVLAIAITLKPCKIIGMALL